MAQVARVGGVTREINVIIDPDKLNARGVTAAQVNNALRAANLDSPGGRVQVGGEPAASVARDYLTRNGFIK